MPMTHTLFHWGKKMMGFVLSLLLPSPLVF